MPFAIQQAQIPAGGSHTFDFGEKLYGYIVGMSQFQIAYGLVGTDAHSVQEIEIALDPSDSGNTGVDVLVNATLKDTGGHSYDAGQTWAVVTVIAQVGGAAADVTIVPSTTVAGTGVTAPGGVTLNGFGDGQPAVLVTPLTSFDLSYGSKANNIEVIQASVSGTCSVASGAGTLSLSGAYELYDNNSHSATSATVTGSALVAWSELADQLLAAPLLTVNQTNTGIQHEFRVPVAEAYGLITGFQLSYGAGTDHQITSLGVQVGENGALTTSGKVVSAAPVVWMVDNATFGPNTEDLGSSNLSMVIVAIPETRISSS